MNITVTNVVDVEIEIFAEWVSSNINGVRIPQPGPNLSAVGIIPEVAKLIVEIPNKMELATELYSIVSGALARFKHDKSKLEKGDLRTSLEAQIIYISTKQDILYRAIQTLQTTYDGASRLVTIIDNQTKLNKYSNG